MAIDSHRYRRAPMVGVISNDPTRLAAFVTWCHTRLFMYDRSARDLISRITVAEAILGTPLTADKQKIPHDAISHCRTRLTVGGEITSGDKAKLNRIDNAIKKYNQWIEESGGV